MKLDFERRSGLPFDDVRVHYNSEKPARLGALAYTQGTQIHVGPGQERTLPHELGHVVQQKAGRVRPTRWIGGLPVNDRPELEREADLAPTPCMSVLALCSVLQMALPVMTAQKGSNCGYHALARAFLKFRDCFPSNSPTDDILETSLTAYAIQQGFSLVGEAFDPFVLAHVGNLFCDKYSIPIECKTISIGTAENFASILNASAGNNSVILVPYFVIGNFEPAVNETGEKSAHWSAIDTEKTTIGSQTKYTYKLYEGNEHGSIPYGESTAGPSLEISPEQLYESNQSIQPEFEWFHYIYQSGLGAYFKDVKKSAVIDALIKAIEGNYIFYCKKNHLNFGDSQVLTDYLYSLECEDAVRQNDASLYKKIFSDGSSDISAQQKVFAPGSANFYDLPGFIDHLKTVMDTINSIHEKEGIPPLEFDSANAIQGVSLKGFAVEVKKR